MRGVRRGRDPRAASTRRSTLVQLRATRDKLPGQLSGGQQQRVAIARAIVIEPPLVLMDEPLSNLDAKLRLEMRTEIRRIHRELGRTTIYVTHDQEEALSLADRIVVLQEGWCSRSARRRRCTRSPANRTSRGSWAIATCSSCDAERATEGASRCAAPAIALAGTAPQSDRAGGRVPVAIRPEDIEPCGAGANAIDGRVENVEYGGRDSLVDLVAADGMHDLRAQRAARR